jgi:anti-anti-sigma factor
VILDLSRCDWMEAVGIAALLRLYKSLRETNGMFVLCGLAPALLELLRITQLDTLLTIQPDLSSARRFLQGAP